MNKIQDILKSIGFDVIYQEAVLSRSDLTKNLFIPSKATIIPNKNENWYNNVFDQLSKKGYKSLSLWPDMFKREEVVITIHIKEFIDKTIQLDLSFTTSIKSIDQLDKFPITIDDFLEIFKSEIRDSNLKLILN